MPWFWVATAAAIAGVIIPYIAIFTSWAGIRLHYYQRNLRLACLELSLLLGIVGVAVAGSTPTSYGWLMAIVLVDALAQFSNPQRFLTGMDNPVHAGANEVGTGPGLASGDAVIGLAFAGEVGAYPLSLISGFHAVNDRISGKPILAVCGPAGQNPAAFLASARGTQLAFDTVGIFQRKLVLRDRQTGSIWRQPQNEALYGPLKGAHLMPIDGEFTSWGQWAAQNPTGWVALPPKNGKQPRMRNWINRLLVQGVGH